MLESSKLTIIITDRDPEAEAEEKLEEDKVPGAEEVGAAAIEAGTFAGTGDWEAAPAGFSGAQGGWDGANDEWAGAVATGATGTTAAPVAEWGATDAKESTW